MILYQWILKELRARFSYQCVLKDLRDCRQISPAQPNGRSLETRDSLTRAMVAPFLILRLMIAQHECQRLRVWRIFLRFGAFFLVARRVFEGPLLAPAGEGEVKA